ncbi:MAG TPA: metal-sensitive transcriptional regulator [Candidatus Hydrogenedentes bacterium]|jgi:DNA-binding FrmR family transcriptional regulator|nr:metal-sensitive transcriptional regulator [Candidatus Hydrogenedentota bacterium]
MKRAATTPRDAVLTRLNRIEGQVRGIKKMVENSRPCVDVLRQMAATDSALRSVAKLIITEHMDSCFEETMKDSETRKQFLAELLESFGRFG